MSEETALEETMKQQNGKEPAPDRLRCSCSVMGFEDPLWKSGYYPPDCPDDWRVAYFCNDFRSVYLTAGDWVGNTVLLDTMVEDLDPGFDLVLEWPSDLSLAQHRALCKQLAPLQNNIACVVVNTAALDLAGLRELLQILSAYFTLNITPPADLELTTLELTALLRAFSAGVLWYPMQAPLVASNCRYQLVVLPCIGLREMTPVLQQLDKMLTATQRVGVFLQAQERSPQRALELRTVIELMEMD